MENFGGDGGESMPHYPAMPILVEFQEGSSSEPPISSWVKEVRIKSGFTRRQLAEMVGVHEKTVESWEIGKTVPRQAKQQMLASLTSEVTMNNDK